MDGTWQIKNIIEYFQLASEDWSYVKMFCIASKMDGMPLCPSKNLRIRLRRKSTITHVIISPESERDGGQVKRICHKVRHVPHITDISLGTRVPQLLYLAPYQPWTQIFLCCHKIFLHIPHSIRVVAVLWCVWAELLGWKSLREIWVSVNLRGLDLAWPLNVVDVALCCCWLLLSSCQLPLSSLSRPTGPGLTDCHDHYFIMDGPGITLSSESRPGDWCANVIIVNIPWDVA